MANLVFVRYLPKAGQESAVEATLRVMVSKTRAETGNRGYNLYRSTGAHGRLEYNLIERYADDSALQAHRETEHYKAYRATIVALLEEPIAVTILDALDERAL